MEYIEFQTAMEKEISLAAQRNERIKETF